MRFGPYYSADVFEVDLGSHYMGTLRVLVGLQVHKPPEWCQSRQRRVSDPWRRGGKSLGYFFSGVDTYVLRLYLRELWIFFSFLRKKVRTHIEK